MTTGHDNGRQTTQGRAALARASTMPPMPPPLRISDKLVVRMRKQRGWTAAHLAQLVGTTQQTINKIEMGTIKYSKYFAGIKDALGITDEMLRDNSGMPIPLDLPAMEADPTLPLHVCFGRISRSVYRLVNCPVCKIQRPAMLKGANNAYAMLMPDDSMRPEFRAGDTLLVQPSAPPEVGESHVFRSGDGDSRVARLLAKNADHYRVEAAGNNEGDEANDRIPITWEPHLIVGRYRHYEP